MGSVYNLLSLSLLLTFASLQTVCGNAEITALMKIKASLDPENKFLSSWASNGDPCSGSFEGVACNEHRKVANISLQGKGLSGKLSPAVAGLECLSGLYLHYNSLTGIIPKEVANLTELIDLYLNFNSFSGGIPPQIGNMASLQVLQLCSNQLTGSIPRQIGSLKKLTVLSLQYNQLTGAVPASLGNLVNLRRLDLSFNRLFGSIPSRLADIPQLEVLNVQNNSLSGVAPTGLKRLNGGFQYENNSDLCGNGFSSLRACTPSDNLTINIPEPFGFNINTTAANKSPKTSNSTSHCNQKYCPNSSQFSHIAVISGVITVTVSLAVVGFLTVLMHRRRKQKIGTALDTSDGRLSIDEVKEFYTKNASPLVSLEYSNGWDPLSERNDNFLSKENLQKFVFNLEEIESATQYFSGVNLLGKSNFSAVYKGILRDGSFVAVKSISVTSCKSEETEFVKGLKLLTSLRHENLIRLKGFCCSKGRGECFLVYDFAPNGNLSQFLDLKDGSSQILDWSTRVSIINGIARGIAYLHSSQANKRALIHKHISAEKILIDQNFNPLISDSGLYKLLADDIVFSALKVSAALGYLAPEYIITGRFTEKSDVYAFGVIILQIISGKQRLTSLMKLAAESCKFDDFIDSNLEGKFSEDEAVIMGKIALDCTNEHPDQRPTMDDVIHELRKYGTN